MRSITSAPFAAVLSFSEPFASWPILFDAIKDLNSRGLTILMVEQNARQGLAASHRGYVLELGKEKFEGSAQELLDSPEMAKLYLGGSTENGEAYRRKAKVS